MTRTCKYAKKQDIHQQVTDTIIASIEAGAGKWQMPWHRSGEGLSIPAKHAMVYQCARYKISRSIPGGYPSALVLFSSPVTVAQ